MKIALLNSVLVLFFFLSFAAKGQYGPYEQPNSLNSQLSSKSISKIVQDKEGYLWIGTNDGLNKYDGHSFTIYKNIPGDSTSLPDNYISSLTVDVSGNLWIGYSNGYISSYNPKTKRFNHSNGSDLGLKGDLISRIFFDRGGRMWVTVAKNGLYYFDKTTKRFLKAGDLPDIHKEYQTSPTFYEMYNSIYDIYEDSAGLFWLATHDGLYLYNPTTNVFKSLRQKKIVPFKDRFDLFNKILPAKDGLWFSSWGGGLTFYNPQTDEWRNYRPTAGTPATHNIIESLIWKERDKQLWITSADLGLGYFDIKKEKFVFFDTEQCEEILTDTRGVLWVSSKVNGLMQFDPFTLLAFQKTSVTRSDNGEYYFTNGFYHDVSNRTLYYGVSYGDGIHVVDEDTDKESFYSFETFPSSEQALLVSNIYKDNRDTLWVLTSDYIYWFDQTKRALIKFQQPADNALAVAKELTPDFFRMIRASNGDLWITSLNKGVYRYSFREKKFVNYSLHKLNDTSNNSIRAIEEDEQGRIWVISNANIYIYSYADNNFRSIESVIPQASQVELSNFSDLTKSSDGVLWIGSDNGIYHYTQSDSAQFVRWTPKDGQPLGKIKYVKTDNTGLVWFLTPSGLWNLNPQNEKFTYTSNIQANIRSSCLYIDDANQIYIGMYGGYHSFNLNKLTIGSKAPPLAITSFKVNNREILIDSLIKKNVNLKHNENSITFEFAALDFRNTSKNSYSFMLEGIDKAWTKNSHQHLANYVQLPPGHYTFKVKAAAQEGVWSEPLQIGITISPPFWQTWYFLSGFALLLIYIVYQFLKWRANVIRKEEVLKSEFKKKIMETEMNTLRAQMNPHFIFNSLNSINKYILMADRETASFYLTKFSKLIRLILENSDKVRISLDQELTALKHYIDMELLRFDHAFSYNIHIDADVNPVSIQFPPLIIQPYVENSIWHGFVRRDTCGILTITIKKESPDVLLIIIEDNGVGRNFKKTTLEPSSKRSHGLKITADRLNILSQEGTPSSVEIIDLKNEHNEALGTRVIIRFSTIINAA